MPHFKIKTALDSMKATLEPVSEVGTGLTNTSEVLAKCKELEITFGVDKDAIDAAFAMSECFESVPFAKGESAGKPIDAMVKFEINMSSEPVFVENPDADKIDYKESMVIPLVQEGDLLGEYIPAQKGKSGFNVFGEELPGILGESITVNAGDGVRKEGNKFYATTQGRPSYSLGKLEVSELLEIDGDVCLATGNISFPGSVLVKGSVLDGFSVTCGGVLDVLGTVGAATIQVEGMLRVQRGVIGRDNCNINAKGGMEIGFANNANLTSKSDICITKDLLHCKAYSLSRIKVQKGSIIGGEVVAAKGVESNELGSESGVRTKVSMRINYETILLREALERLLQEADEIFQRSRSFLANREIPEKYKVQVDDDLEELSKLEAKLLKLEQQIKAREEELSKVEGICIRVHRKVYPDVVLIAPNCKYLTENPIEGNKVFVDDIETSSMVVKNG